MGATKIMVIRHGEKPGNYDGKAYSGVDALGAVSGEGGAKHLTTLGWERAGALGALFAKPWGPKSPLATPQFLFASDPVAKHDDDASDEGPSQRPYETLTALAAKLRLPIEASHRKKHLTELVADALTRDGAVLISWQHEDIALKTKVGGHGISWEILNQTRTVDPSVTAAVPTTWPTAPADSAGAVTARYDLVFVFDRPNGSGPITKFTLFAQQLLAGDLP
jgi:hypothetical protein